MERRKATPHRRGEAENTIPLVDLHPQHDSLHESIMQAMGRVARSQQFVNGGEVELFEREMAGYLGVEHAVAMSSGTDALLAALMALGIGEGDEVVTTAFSFVATAEVILRLGARPVFVDIRPDDYFIDIDGVRQAMTRRTRAIVVAHLFGGAGPVEQIA
ncbi:MAG: DegT/DnrJ/EryC1/StrS aminotransferase family protein, partial [Deltaproteobacteria bacterium]